MSDHRIAVSWPRGKAVVELPPGPPLWVLDALIAYLEEVRHKVLGECAKAERSKTGGA